MPRIANSADFLAAPYGGSAFPKWSKARDLAYTRTGTRPARIAFVGDSKTMGAGAGGVDGPRFVTNSFAASRPARVAQLLAASGVAVYQGFMGYNGTTTPAERMAYDPRLQLTGTGGGSRSIAGIITFGGTGTFASYTQGQAIDRFSVLTQWDATRPPFTVAKGSETFTLTPVGATTGAFSRQEVVFTTKDNAAIALAKPGASGTSQIIGGVAWDSANPGIEVMNCGVYGITTITTITPSANNGTDFLPAIASYAPDLTVINLGTNDVLNSTGITLDQYLAAMLAIVNAASVSGDVILTWPAIGGVSPSYGDDAKRATWRDALRALAYANGCMFIDEETLLGGRARSQSNNAMIDGVHENAWTYMTEARPLANLIMNG